MIRQHDVQVLAEGTFRVVLTQSMRVVTAIDVPDSALGPLHLVFAVSPGAMAESTFSTGGLFGGIEHAVGSVARGLGRAAEASAEGTFNAAARVASTVARPAVDLTRDAAAVSASLVAHVPFVPAAERERIEAASRTIMRARLGDITAQQFIRDVGQAAKAGVGVARHAGDALLAGTRVVSRVLDVPLAQLGKVPGVGGSLHALDPFVKLDHVAGAIQRGDFEGLKRMIENDARMAAGVVAFIPGVGSVASAALSAGLAVLDGGGPLDIAVHTAYGAIPIPPGLKDITDGVLDAVLSLAHHPKGVTDAALAAARSQVPSGLPRHVFDTLANLVVHHVPVTHVAQDLVGAYVKRYAPDLPVVANVGGVASKVASVAKVAESLHPKVSATVAVDLVAPRFRLPSPSPSAMAAGGTP